jgi:hypothetical protein
VEVSLGVAKRTVQQGLAKKLSAVLASLVRLDELVSDSPLFPYAHGTWINKGWTARGHCAKLTAARRSMRALAGGLLRSWDLFLSTYKGGAAETCLLVSYRPLAHLSAGALEAAPRGRDLLKLAHCRTDSSPGTRTKTSI